MLCVVGECGATAALQQLAVATVHQRQSPSLPLPATVSLKETAYTEVEMHHHQAAPGTASKTIYTTTGAADSYGEPVEENGDDMYSVVREPEQAPTYSTVDLPAVPRPAAGAAAVV